MNKKTPVPFRYGGLLLCLDSGLFAQSLDASLANELTLVFHKVFGLAAEGAVGLMLLEDDAIAFNVNFNGVFLGQTKGSSHLDGKYDSAQLVKFADYAGCFHGVFLLSKNVREGRTLRCNSVPSFLQSPANSTRKTNKSQC